MNMNIFEFLIPSPVIKCVRVFHCQNRPEQSDKYPEFVPFRILNEIANDFELANEFVQIEQKKTICGGGPTRYI